MIQTMVNGAQAISKNRSAQTDYTRTQGGVVKSVRSGPFLHTFSITPGYPTREELNSIVSDLLDNQVGPYTLTMSEFVVRTNDVYVGSSNTPVVNGGSQTDNTIAIDGLAADTTNVFQRGDTVQFAGVDFTYVVIENASSNADGEATLTLDMPVASAPDDNAVVRVGTDIQWNLYLEEIPLELGSGNLPFNASYSGAFLFREGR